MTIIRPKNRFKVAKYDDLRVIHRFFRDIDMNTGFSGYGESHESGDMGSNPAGC